MHERIEERGDAWRDYAKTRQTIAKAMKAIGVERVAALSAARAQIAPTLPVTGRTMPVM